MTKYDFHQLQKTNSKEYGKLRWQLYKQKLGKRYIKKPKGLQPYQICAEKSLCECVPMTKPQQIKEVLQTLIEQNKEVGYYHKKDIEKAIMACRGGDERTLKNWFRLLWTLEYFLQPQPGIYHLNLSMITKLELKTTIQITPQQKRLVELGKGE
jgi:hypothetical protein